MPRTGRGGARAGTPGKAYPNRSDMPGKVLPVAAAKGQTYGERGEQESAQRAVPMAGAPTSAGPPAAAPGPAGIELPAQLPPGVFPPGKGTPLDAPTHRPNEPVTAGAASGPGPDMSALGPDPQTLMRNADFVALAPYLPAMEEAANRQESTMSTRQIVRRLKGTA